MKSKWLLPIGLVLVICARFPPAWMQYHLAKWLGVYLIATAATLVAFARGFSLPALPKKAGIAVAGVAAAAIAHLFYFNSVNWVFSLLDRVSFFALALLAFSQFRRKELCWEDFRRPFLGGLALVAAIGLWQMAEIGFPGVMPFTKVASTFGYANITAQFVAIAMLFLIFCGLPQLKAERWLTVAVLLSGLTYLFLLRGRSVLAGFLLAVAVALFYRWKSGQKLFRWSWVAGAVALVFTFLVGFQVAKGKTIGEALRFSMYAEKSEILVYRQDVWTQTLRMIADKPFGVGVDRFEFEFVPYHRFGSTISYASLELSPHNEFLRYLAEDGIPLALAFFVLLALLLRAWWRNASVASRGFHLPLLVFYGAEMLFQFPWQLGFPVYFGAILFGSLAAEAFAEYRLKESVSGAVLSLLLLFQLIGTAQAFIVRSFENSDKPDRLAMVCRLVPADWRSCIKLARMEADLGNVPAARARLLAEMERAPWNFYAWRFMGMVALRGGDKLEGCFYHWRYLDLFQKYDKEMQAVRELMGQICQDKWLEYFNRKRPTKYYPGGSLRPSVVP